MYKCLLICSILVLPVLSGDWDIVCEDTSTEWCGDWSPSSVDKTSVATTSEAETSLVTEDGGKTNFNAGQKSVATTSVDTTSGEKSSVTLESDTLIDEKESWLKFYYTPKKWNDAVVACYNEGAVLASPLHKTLTEALSTNMKRISMDEPMFTGISNVYSKAVYQSIEGVLLSDIKLTWSSEPKGSSSYNCIGLNPNGTVTEVSCSEPRPFACYGNKKIGTNVCGTSDPEYVYNNVTRSCYKLHRKLANWHEAFKICDLEGGYLAIVNSEDEAKVIWNIGFNSPWTYALALGFREWGSDRVWITVKGQSLREAGYSKWYPGEPNILSENCGSFVHWGPVSDGILADMPCQVDVMFICEINP